MPAYARLVDEAVAWARKRGAPVGAATDRLAIDFGVELTRIVPGRVSTEVDADLSFDVAGTIAKARTLIADYQARGVGRERILIKIAATWEGAEAAAVLQREGIDCNLTLMFSLPQAIACADAGAFLVSPFVGRILDWHVKAGGGPYTGATDPGVQSVRAIYAYYKTYGVKTVVMGASFRNAGEIEALAGCDRLTISPHLLDALAHDEGPLARKMSPDAPGPRRPASPWTKRASAGCSTRTRWRRKSSARASASSHAIWRRCAKWSDDGWRWRRDPLLPFGRRWRRSRRMRGRAKRGGSPREMSTSRSRHGDASPSLPHATLRARTARQRGASRGPHFARCRRSTQVGPSASLAQTTGVGR